MTTFESNFVCWRCKQSLFSGRRQAVHFGLTTFDKVCLKSLKYTFSSAQLEKLRIKAEGVNSDCKFALRSCFVIDELQRVIDRKCSLRSDARCNRRPHAEKSTDIVALCDVVRNSTVRSRC
jgi:hypothetical protein